MIETLELTNFMSVEYAKHTFSPGLNVMRGANEAGKSTRFLAIAYALWGARALPDSLDDTVTWGKPASSLKVTLAFTICGKSFSITRSKSGAELVGDGLLSSGQSEVTAQVERLTGANSLVGLATLLTNQGGLQDSLASVSLIEKLSDTALVDRIISAVSHNLPSGNTKLLETELAKELLQPVEIDHKLQESVGVHKESLLSAQAEQRKLAEQLRTLEPPLIGAKALLDRNIHTRKTVVDLQRRIQPKRKTPVKPVEPRSLEELEALKAEAEGLDRARRARELFDSLPPKGHKGTLGDYINQQSSNSVAISVLRKSLNELSAQRVEVKAKGIWETSCGLCGKYLADVPEVVKINRDVSAALASLDSLIEADTGRLDVLNTLDKKLSAVITQSEIAKIKLRSINEYCCVDYSYSPPEAIWVGPSNLSAPIEDFSSLIRELHNARLLYAKALAEIVAHNDLMDKLTVELHGVQVLEDEKEALQLLDSYEEFRKACSAADLQVIQAAKQLNEVEHELDKAKMVYAAQLTAYTKAREAKDNLAEVLKEYKANNSLIAKLRQTKPEIAKALWSLVLYSVSTVFSQIRGVPSVVTKSADGFLIDGKKAQSYSGSTKDILGLAIRITLQKTFLPNLNFCLLDEPAASSDSVREEAMIAALSRIDFAQILLVTHSDLADTFANTVHAI